MAKTTRDEIIKYLHTSIVPKVSKHLPEYGETGIMVRLALKELVHEMLHIEEAIEASKTFTGD